MIKNDFKRFMTPSVLQGDRIILRKMSKEDLSDVFEYASDPKVSEFLLWSPHRSKDFTKKYLFYVEKRYKRAEFYDWAIEYDGKMIGTCGFTSLSLENQCGEIGFVLNSKYWGMGIAKEAADLVIKYGFEVLELNRIEARYMSENTQSRRVMEKCGMTYEGTHYSSLFVKGKYRDVGICAILKDEFFGK